MNRILIDHLRIEAADLQRMRERPGAWRCYQDLDLHSAGFGKLDFEIDGASPPPHWGWTFMGFVDVQHGHVFEEQE